MPRKKEIVSGSFVKYDAVVLGSGPAGEGAPPPEMRFPADSPPTAPPALCASFIAPPAAVPTAVAIPATAPAASEKPREGAPPITSETNLGTAQTTTHRMMAPPTSS